MTIHDQDSLWLLLNIIEVSSDLNLYMVSQIFKIIGNALALNTDFT
jgi:hypothetical protein